MMLFVNSMYNTQKITQLLFWLEQTYLPIRIIFDLCIKLKRVWLYHNSNWPKTKDSLLFFVWNIPARNIWLVVIALGQVYDHKICMALCNFIGSR